MYRSLGALALLVAALSAVAIAGIAPAAGASAADSAPHSVAPAPAGAATPPATAAAPAVQSDGNESERPRHEHPDSAAGQGDDGAVAEWLLGELEGSLEESAVRISEGQYETGREALGEDYQRRLSQYVDVAGDTDWQTEDESDPRTRHEVAAEEYATVRETQAELSDVLAEYEETLAAYEQARDSGDEERALELARDLVALGDRIEALGGELDERYARIEAVAERDLSPVTAPIDERRRATRTETERVAEDAFRETTLTVDVRDATVSPSTPLRVDGRLVDEDGAPMENATIAVTEPVAAAPSGAAGTSEPIGSGATTTVRTGPNGTFELAHRPTFVPTDLEQLTVEYRPERLSPHRAASEDVAVSVGRVAGDVRVASDPSSVQYGDEIDVGVVASAAGEPVSGVPFELTVGGAHATGVTDESGAVRLSTPVSRDLSPGEATVSIDVPVEGWSVAFDASESTVDVEATPTSLTAETRRAANGTGVEVAGRLTTDDGTPVGGAPVEIAPVGSGSVSEVGAPAGDAADAGAASASSAGGGDATVVARTDEDGAYAATIETTGDVDAVVARYAEADANLEDAEATAELPGSSGDGPGDSLAGRLAALARPTVGGPLVGILLLLGGVVAWRRWTPSSDGDGPGPSSAGTTSTEPVPDSLESTDLLAAADGTLAESPSRATILAYGAGRDALASEVAASADATHWEFYQACHENGFDGETLEAVRIMTERYEAAAYAPGDVDADVARDALAAAKHVQ